MDRIALIDQLVPTTHDLLHSLLAPHFKHSYREKSERRVLGISNLTTRNDSLLTSGTVIEKNRVSGAGGIPNLITRDDLNTRDIMSNLNIRDGMSHLNARNDRRRLGSHHQSRRGSCYICQIGPMSIPR